MNRFCIKDCTGGDIKEVIECIDRYCPFHSFRFDDLDWQRKRRKYENEQSTIKA